ncbi:hypothetical protein [Nitrosospira multiformis]|uniref:hypothetical protein n=1 Tax=Nitrosospira multiformis TaxID=1231 RepID=UPI0008957B44|nr:hypothetical protein [Nitrosospira multiformis]SEA58203.1 hypothetical protein SAMN05216411_11358 [Nitrosospira multiformis]
MDSSFVTTSILAILALAGFFLLVVWFFRKMTRGELRMGSHAALLVLLAAMLLVPFAMNFSAHLISSIGQRSVHSEEVSSQRGDY